MRLPLYLLYLPSLVLLSGCLLGCGGGGGGSAASPSAPTPPSLNAPTVAISSPAANTTTSSTISLSGTCTASVSTVDISGASPASTSCAANGTYSVSITLSAPAGSKTVTVSQTNNDGTGTDSRIFILNPLVPSILITSPAASTITASTITIQGSCDSSVSTINISGATPTSTTCSSGTFSQVITLSGVDGNKAPIFSQTNGSGTGSDNRTFILDTASPTSTSISINAGAAYTNSTSAALTLSATDSNSGIQIYITNTAGCGSGGTYEAYSTSKSWTLAQTNSTATVYVKFKDSVSNESSCISDSIIHDSIAPSIAYSSPSDGSYGTTGLTVSGTCENGIAVTLNGSGITSTTATCSSGSFSSAVAFTAGEGNKPITISQTDLAGNSTSAARTFVRDNTNPNNVTFTAPSSNLSTSSSAYNFIWSAASDNYTVASYKVESFQNNSCSGGPTSTINSQAGTSYNLTLNNGDNTVKVYTRDGAGNLSTGLCSNTVGYIPPTIAMFKAGPFNGNLGGRSGANTKCVSAKPVGVTQANVKAFVSLATTDEIRNMPTNYGVAINQEIRSETGSRIAANWTALMSGSIEMTLLAAGVPFNGNWWSFGNNVPGAGFTEYMGDNFACVGGTSSSSFIEGAYGNSGFTDTRWLYNTPFLFCNNTAYLLCIAFD